MAGSPTMGIGAAVAGPSLSLSGAFKPRRPGELEPKLDPSVQHTVVDKDKQIHAFTNRDKSSMDPLVQAKTVDYLARKLQLDPKALTVSISDKLVLITTPDPRAFQVNSASQMGHAIRPSSR